ncbi:MAG: aldo/keto reductase [Methanosphaera sp.]|nr:aldo/keto reductase [Methanosphaera sp.]
MKYRTLGKTGIKSSILGFGAMRLPLNSDNPEDVNLVETRKMLDYAVDNGVNMFDTALVYHTIDRSKPGVSETILGNFLGEYDDLHISTKMPSWNILSWEYFDKTLDQHLERLNRDSIEMFFVHSIKDSYYETIKERGLYDFIDRAVDDGRIEHVGFSSHASYDVLMQILSDYDKWEFALTQINYVDNEENPGLKGLREFKKLDIGTMIMEPLRGGQLAENQPEPVQDLFDKSSKDFSPVEWALYYLWENSDINCVLSGMSSLEQVKCNVDLASNYRSGCLDSDDYRLLDDVKNLYSSLKNIPCTGCNYCMPCPFGVNIPKCFYEFNMDKLSGSNNQSVQYRFHLHDDKKAHNCTKCGKCSSVCPQSIDIPSWLGVVEDHFGE